MTKSTIKIGIIGGSGLYAIKGIEKVGAVNPMTQWGYPSSEIEIYETSDKIQIAFLSRHGKDHHLNPSEVPFRANIAALKSLGVEFILAFTAVGSLNGDMNPGHFVLPDQVFDKTKGIRDSTFFEKGLVAHVPFAEPFSAKLRDFLFDFEVQFQQSNIKLHGKANLVVMEGPCFSTNLETNLYRSWGFDVINMSTLPESKLAMEAEIQYQPIAMVTDSWKEEVSVASIMNVMKENSVKFHTILETVIAPLSKAISDGILVNSLKDQVSSSLMYKADLQDAKYRFEFLFGSNN